MRELHSDAFLICSKESVPLYPERKTGRGRALLILCFGKASCNKTEQKTRRSAYVYPYCLDIVIG
jgi:hypothetical protein